MISADEVWPKLEELGEEVVRKRLVQGIYSPQKIPLVEEWLASKERQRQNTAIQQQDTRADEALKRSAEANSIARESNEIALKGNAISSRAMWAAWFAVGISVLALLVAIAK